MGEINFIELATFCQNEKRDAYEKMNDTIYAFTIFVAITEDNHVLASRTPHILSNAYKCILVHSRSTLAITNRYNWYDIQFINECGQVLDDALDDEFSLSVYACGGYANQRISLAADGILYYSASMPCDNSIEDLWMLYLKLKDAKSRTERELISELFRKDKKILDLEKNIEDFKFQTHLLKEEKAMFKELLQKIQSLVESNN